MDVMLRILAGVAAAWITPDPMPQPAHPSAYEERGPQERPRLRLVR